MEIKNLTFSYNLQTIFDDVSVFIPEGMKVGVIGANGAGKTTLFKMMKKLIEPHQGKIIIGKNHRLEWLPQVLDDEIPNMNISVFDFLLEARPIKRIETELRECYEKIAISNEEKQKSIFKQIDRLENALSYWDAYKAESVLLKLIDGMNISSDLLDQKLNTLSGGQKSKVAFAKLLYSKPEIILLDEPTNHLDEDSKTFVINYLKKYQGTVLIISHDIDLLNEVTTKTLHIDKVTHKIELFDGNYTTYKKLLKEREKSEERQVQKEDAEIKKLRDIVLLYSNSSGKRKRMAESREKTLNKLLKNRIVVKQKVKNASVSMHINKESNLIPLEVKDLSFKYNKESNKNIINNLSFELIKGEKFLIVGENGVGKSTLLKLIMDELKPDSGVITIGNKTEIGYYAQEHELLDNDLSVINNFDDTNQTEKSLRSILGRFLFTGDDIYKKVSVLSPGERSRLALAKLSMSGANLLILDEPTNHLDPETQQIIGGSFKEYKGTLLVVSHSSKFVDALDIGRTLTLPSGQINYYEKDIIKYYEKINSTKK